MFSIIFLLNLNYTILKSVRKTLAIAAPGGTATSIPFFELFGVLPAAIFMAWFLSKILKKYSLKKVFLFMLFLFTTFFILFAGIYYPKLILLQEKISTPQLLQFASMSFYVMGELWKPALIQILFLGLINYNLTMDQAKSVYPPLMLGASLGAMLAGPLTVFCNSKLLWTLFPLSINIWNHSLIVMMSLVFITGCIVAILFQSLCKYFKNTEKSYEKEKKFSLKEAVSFFKNSRPLKLMGWIVFADYIAYSLAEVLFLGILKIKYPLPQDYCTFMGHLSSWHSALTILLAIVVAPICLRKIKWVTCAIILPVGLLVSEGVFFFFLCQESLASKLFNLTHSQWLTALVFIGSALFCVCRAVKYTIFDPCKELAFVSMPGADRMKGKLVIDGLCAKFGKGASSGAAISLISISGGLMASASLTGIIAIGICLSLIISTDRLGAQLNGKQLNPVST
ncbi:MAG: ADP,ATP carrier protein 1 [Chlamydiia bacterium]|nr:ADP,ATP carrier protein 1 [Chlamydiia bacterium]MCH9618858.1 ADP,ATP carrier protein 1 [Chlamydiia bacterium]MCH9624541.1 ADP,ATP carrier protein 1 [Chlamydiia bacterium]